MLVYSTTLPQPDLRIFLFAAAIAFSITACNTSPQDTSNINIPGSGIGFTEQKAPASNLATEISDVKGVKMRLVPAGPFTMGNDNVNSSYEEPSHLVILDDYYIDMYEVTNARYARCVRGGPCTEPSIPSAYSNEAFKDFPVTYVSWYQAKTYCEWRGQRLPTEAEWEKAARGTDGRTYPWGEGIDCSRANYSHKSCSGMPAWAAEEFDEKVLQAVGSYNSGISPYGLYDMAGNVEEWVNDWYDYQYYENSPSANPQGASTGEDKLLRGGSWSASTEDGLRTSARNWHEPSMAALWIGFRCARSP